MIGSFSDRLAEAVRTKSSSVCVGLDPRWASLPESLTKGVDCKDLEKVAELTAQYSCAVLDAVVDYAAIVKPQAAFYEQLGPWGMQALYTTIQHARKLGLLVVLDAKRGDIGSTAEGYAQAYLGEQSPWQADALTVNPYLGADTLEPFVNTCQQNAAGIFVLVKTSNPGSGFIQDKQVGGSGPTIYSNVAEHVQQLNLQSLGKCGFGQVGAVVGATYPEQLSALRAAMSNAWLLIPGYGAQGGTAEDVAHGFRDDGLGAVVNSSRGIIFAYRQERYVNLPWQEAIAKAAEQMASEIPAPAAKDYK